MATPEKRAHKRTLVTLPARVRAGASEMEGTVDNLGALGALVSTPNLEAPLAVGDEVTLTLETDEGDVEVAGKILRLDQEFAGGDIRRTFAVKFHGALERD